MISRRKIFDYNLVLRLALDDCRTSQLFFTNFSFGIETIILFNL